MFVRFENKSKHARDASEVRRHNTRVLLRRIWEDDAISRAELARQTGLARSTVSAIVQDLMGLGILREARVARRGGGRPPLALSFVHGEFGLVGVEMGASHITAVVTDLRGAVSSSQSQSWDVQSDPEGALDLLVALVTMAIASSKLPRKRIIGMGVAVPCPVDHRRPNELSARILPAWEGVAVADILEKRLRLPLLLDNDANLGALAEFRWGAGRGVENMSYIKVATGVGGGHIINGGIYRGSSGIAGEIGHTAIDPSGARCRCGLSGCLEAWVGSRALETAAHDALRAGRESSLAAYDPLTLADIVSEARRGDPLAVALIQRAGQHLGVAVANLINLLNPSKIVLGGRLTKAGDLLLKPLRDSLTLRALSTSVRHGDVVFSELGDDEIALGAATMVLDRALSDPQMFTAASAVRESL